MSGRLFWFVDTNAREKRKDYYAKIIAEQQKKITLQKKAGCLPLSREHVKDAILFICNVTVVMFRVVPYLHIHIHKQCILFWPNETLPNTETRLTTRCGGMKPSSLGLKKTTFGVQGVGVAMVISGTAPASELTDAFRASPGQTRTDLFALGLSFFSKSPYSLTVSPRFSLGFGAQSIPIWRF